MALLDHEKARKQRRFLREKAAFRMLVSLPTSAQFLNVIEGVLSRMVSALMATQNSPLSCTDLKRKIAADGHKTCKIPFVQITNRREK
jgi:hypothetical protein